MQILKSNSEDKEEWVLKIPGWINEDIEPITQKQGKLECAKFSYGSGCLSQCWTHKNQILKGS